MSPGAPTVSTYNKVQEREMIHKLQYEQKTKEGYIFDVTRLYLFKLLLFSKKVLRNTYVKD